MQKYLITGCTGFVGKHFLKYLDDNEIPAQVLGIDINLPDERQSDYKCIRWHYEIFDLLDTDKLTNIMYQFQPNLILHLASYSSVAFSWKEPISSFQNNTNIFLNLLEAVRKLNLKARILSVGSSEEYGKVSKENLPLTEDSPLMPSSPYAVARVSQELLSKIYVDGYGLDIIMTRSFNHLGSGQKEIFALSSFAKQIVEIKKAGLEEGELIVGDISVVRDFVDVRDVVSAYYLILQKGKRGEVYNVCTGRGISLEEIIKKMAALLGVKVRVRMGEKLMRPTDNSVIIGSNEKLKKEADWQIRYSMEESLQDVMAYWMQK